MRARRYGGLDMAANLRGGYFNRCRASERQMVGTVAGTKRPQRPKVPFYWDFPGEMAERVSAEG